MNYLSHALQAVLSCIAPAFCMYCKKLLANQSDTFCMVCDERIKPIVSTLLPINKHYSMPVFAVTAYQEPIKTLIMAKHYGDIVASSHMGKLLWQRSALLHIDFDYIVPIPLHWTRYAWRGYNQTLHIAKTLSYYSAKPIANILKRERKTVFQASLSGPERHENLKQAFTLSLKERDYQHYIGKRLLIVDDLMTTGATLRSAAKVLSVLQPATLSAAVVCRVL